MLPAPDAPSFLLTLSCGDRSGIVAAIAGHLAAINGFILDSQQYADLKAGRFFLRMELRGRTSAASSRSAPPRIS